MNPVYGRHYQCWTFASDFAAVQYGLWTTFILPAVSLYCIVLLHSTALTAHHQQHHCSTLQYTAGRGSRETLARWVIAKATAEVGGGVEALEDKSPSTSCGSNLASWTGTKGGEGRGRRREGATTGARNDERSSSIHIHIHIHHHQNHPHHRSHDPGGHPGRSGASSWLGPGRGPGPCCCKLKLSSTGKPPAAPQPQNNLQISLPVSTCALHALPVWASVVCQPCTPNRDQTSEQI